MPIPELPFANRGSPGFLFSLESSRLQSLEYLWSGFWRSPRGRKVLLYSKQENFHLLRVPGIADFHISADLSEIFCYPLPDIPAETIRHQLLDSILPRTMAHQKKLMLHASAVQFDHGVIVFLGTSGSGKSTLAGTFHQAGQPAISDDAIWLKEDQEGKIWVVPTYEGLRLWDDSLNILFSADQSFHSMAHYSRKKRVLFHDDPTRIPTKGGPALALIVLNTKDGDITPEVQVERLSLRDAFMGMMDETYQLDSEDLDMRVYRMQTIGRVTLKIPAYRLSMPRDYLMLAVARQKILDLVS